MSAGYNEDLFHGGAPGLKPGDVLRPASELGLHFTFDERAIYRRDRVYVTRERDSARSFASNYKTAFGVSEPGDVYRVEARGDLELDPDHPNVGRSKGAFLMARSALILQVVDHGVTLGEAEKWRIDGRHAYWDPTHEPVYGEDGHLTLSPAMRQSGVPAEWLQVIRPWYHPKNLDGGGWFTAEDPVEELFEAVPQLDTSHAIVEQRRALVGPRVFVCSECGLRFGREEIAAAIHQLGDREAAAIMSVFRTEAAIRPVLRAAIERNPGRWRWLP